MTDTPETAPEVTQDPKLFHVSRSSDGEKHWFSAYSPSAGVSIPAKSRDDAYALVSSINRAILLYHRATPEAARHLEVGHDEQPGDYLRDGLLNIAAICEAKALHVEAASLRSTAAIVSEQLRKGQQIPEATQASAGRVKMLRGLLQEFVEAMERYQMDVDDDAPPRHRYMMERASAALASPDDGEA